MTKTTKFFAVDAMGEILGGAHDTHDEAAAACQDAAREDGTDGEGYEVVESGSTEIVIVSPNLGDCDESEYEAEMARLEDAYTAVEGDTRYAVRVRAARSGEAAGTYYRRTDGALQIIGYSVPVPRDLADLNETAWDAFCRADRSLVE